MSALDLKLIIKGRGIGMTRRKKGRKGIDEEAECQEDCLERLWDNLQSAGRRWGLSGGGWFEKGNTDKPE